MSNESKKSFKKAISYSLSHLLYLAICPVVSPWESLLIGFISGAIGCFGDILLVRMRIDDPVHCISTNGITGLWGVVVVGFVVERNPLMSKNSGVFKGGGWKVLGVQVLAATSIALWTSMTTLVYITLYRQADSSGSFVPALPLACA